MAQPRNRMEPPATGYSGTGMSRWTRTNAARSVNWTPRERKRAQPRALIPQTEEQVAALRKELRTCSPTQRDALMKSITIKMKFLDRLYAELESAAS